MANVNFQQSLKNLEQLGNAKVQQRKQHQQEQLRRSEQVALLKSNHAINLTAWRSQLHLMTCCFFSTKRGKDLQPIEYTSPDGSFQIIASPNVQYGLPTVWDADVLDFAITKAREVVPSEADFPSKVRFSGGECLEKLKKNAQSGKNRQWLKQALRRLASTLYVCTLWEEGTLAEQGVTLISYRFVRIKDHHSELVELTFNSWLVESIRDKNILVYDPQITPYLLAEERSGVKKLLLRMLSVRFRSRLKPLEFWQETLMALCKTTEPDFRFRQRLKSLDLPWKVETSKEMGRWKVTFYPKTSF